MKRDSYFKLEPVSSLNRLYLMNSTIVFIHNVSDCAISDLHTLEVLTCILAHAITFTEELSPGLILKWLKCDQVNDTVQKSRVKWCRADS